MPNNCDNTLTVTGPKADLDAFQKAARRDKEPLDINNFIRMPDDVRGTPAERDWAIRNWGTKWGAYECQDVQDRENALQYTFFTAWSPLSEDAIRTVSAKFPSLRFDLEYEEFGMAFKGRTTAQDGRITGQWCRDMTQEELDDVG